MGSALDQVEKTSRTSSFGQRTPLRRPRIDPLGLRPPTLEIGHETDARVFST